MEDGRVTRERWPLRPSERPRHESLGAVPALPLSIEVLICAMPWPCPEAVQVAWCESRLDPGAQNSSGAKGVFQLMHVHSWRLGEGESFFSATVNIRVAWEIFSEQGFEPWRACR